MPMIECQNGHFINSERIEHCWVRERDDKLTMTVSLIGDGVLRAIQYPKEYLDEIQQPVFNRMVIPAQPGWFKLLYWGDPDGEHGILREPIIAWQQVGKDWMPMTLEEESNESAILRPDGRVTELGCCTFDTAEEWLGDVMERERKLRKARQEDMQEAKGSA